MEVLKGHNVSTVNNQTCAILYLLYITVILVKKKKIRGKIFVTLRKFFNDENFANYGSIEFVLGVPITE